MSDRDEQAALIVALIERMRQHGAWCSETSVHKALFLAETMFLVPVGVSWTLYHHGPYAPGLRAKLRALCHGGALECEPDSSAGAHYYPREQGRQILVRHASQVARWEPELDVVARTLAPLAINELEALATAWWVTQESDSDGASARAEALRGVKPHISRERAVAAMGAIDQLREIANEFARQEQIAAGAQTRVRELRSIGLGFYDGLRLAAHEQQMDIPALCDALHRTGRFDGPLAREEKVA